MRNGLALSDNGQIRGSLKFRVLRNGLVKAERFGNLIVTGGRANLAALLAGTTGLHVINVGIGSGNTAAVAADTALTEPVLTNVTEIRVGESLEAEDGTTFDDPRIVQFHFNFGTDIAVGKAVWEYGLICADGSLFSRIVRPTVFNKTDLDRIIGYWQIQF